jgi:RNA polymerase sigma factor (sigma-70 family)
MNTQNLEENWNYYYPKVYGYFFRRLNNRSDVEDLSSVVMTKFFEVLSDEQKSVNLNSNPNSKNAYLWKIAYNSLANFINHKQKTPPYFSIDDDFIGIDSSLEKEYSKHFQERVANLMLCVENSIAGIEYEIVKQSIFEDKTSIELSDFFGLKPATIRQKLCRSLKKLRLKCKKLWQD